MARSHRSVLSARTSHSNPRHEALHAARMEDAGTGLSVGSLATIVVFGTIAVVGGVALVFVFVSRRRASRTKQEEPVFDHTYLDVEDSITTRRKRLQKKKKEWTLETTEIMSPIQPTAAPQIPPLPLKQWKISSLLGKVSPTKSTKSAKSWNKAAWIDEDNLHGPSLAHARDLTGEPLNRDSWPLCTFTPPTLPTVTTEHIHPYYRGYYQQQQMIQTQVAATQEPTGPAGPRLLPQPPRPALVTGNYVTANMGAGGGYYTLQDLVQHGRAITNNTPPKLVPGRPTHRGRPSRQSSTDSTLSEILKSTEQRLAERSPSKSRSGSRAPSRTGNTSSRETLLGGSDRLAMDGTVSGRSTSSSPTRRVVEPNQAPLVSSAHNRSGSDSSAVSEPDSLLAADYSRDMPAGLTSPSRTPKSQGTLEHSPANSVSSGLPTLYSESEAEDEETEPQGLSMQQRASKAQSLPPLTTDPFTSPPASPSKAGGGPRALPNPHALRKATFGSSQQPVINTTSPTALQTRFSTQLRGAATSSSTPSSPNRQSYANLLPLDLYQLCTPVRQTALKTPTIVAPDPEAMCDSVHPKKRTADPASGTANSSPAPSPPPPVPALTTAAQPSPVRAPHQSPTKAYPPPHKLRPKGSSPTLGHYPPLRTATTMASTTSSSPVSSPPPSSTSPSASASGSPSPKAGSTKNRSPKGPRPRPRSTRGSVPSFHVAVRPPSTVAVVGATPPSTAGAGSRASSIYSQDGSLPSTGQQQPAVLDTVAALRRMNSAVSSVSGVSEAASASAASGGGSPTLPAGMVMGRGVAGRGSRRHRRAANNGSRNYLGLLDVGRRGSKLDAVVQVWEEREKENVEAGSGAGGAKKKTKTTPQKNMANGRRGSVDSLGLYDEDGFLISSPVRGGES